MRRASALLAAALAGGCSFGPGMLGEAGERRPPFRDPALTVPAAAQLVVPGRTSRAELLQRLGPAETVRFDTGYEVWVYRTRGAGDPRTTPELVLLLDRDGIVRKLRERPAYPAAR